MNIKKIGHCCLVVEVEGVRIMTDPGSFSHGQAEEKNIDIILITHEHQDHFHLDSLKAVLINNPGTVIVTNSAVGKLLTEQGISWQKLEDGEETMLKDLHIEAHGNTHATIYETVPSVQNTGYLVADRLYYPGDSLFVPPRSVEILALPIAGPWLKLSEAIDYAKAVKPKVCFPVHDAVLAIKGPWHRQPPVALVPVGIEFVVIDDGAEREF